jgi:1-acyl-sn-glycerol-3-phosphate acyltransferase
MISATFVYPFLKYLNALVCRVMYGVRPVTPSPLPPHGPALLVSDHSTMGDPLVLLATAGRPLQFLMAHEIYERWGTRWVFRAFQVIPVRRGTRDIGAIRAMMRALDRGEVVALFPEGGIDNFRDEAGHLGVAYLAAKTGVPVVPVSLRWDGARPESMFGTICVPGKVVVRYGYHLQFPKFPNPKREELEAITAKIMGGIKKLSVDEREQESDNCG